MKLSPPASSSDLEVAREIARRLNQHRRRDDRTHGAAAAEPVEAAPAPALAPPKRPSPPPLPSRRTAREDVEAAPVAMTEEDIFHPEPTSRPEPPRREPPLLKEPPAPPEPPRREPPPRPAAAAARDEFEQSFDAPSPELGAPEVDTWNPSELSPDSEDAPDVEIDTDVDLETSAPDEEPLEALADASPFAAPADDDAVLEDDGLSPEQLVGGDSGDSPLDELAGTEASPFDDAVLDEAAAEEPAGPSWDEVVESCRIVAQATASMLIDPAGQVFSARGDWPAPGPGAIATKLVSTMEKTLKDAPTRSISTPLMGMHLTAWRVPLHEGLVTIAFLGPSPVRGDVRSVIDGEIHRGTGA
jgi:hypothetical protein